MYGGRRDCGDLGVSAIGCKSLLDGVVLEMEGCGCTNLAMSWRSSHPKAQPDLAARPRKAH
jgi:hypothetical protein